MKYTGILFFLFILGTLHAQEQYLNLNQIIDSALQKHPVLKKMELRIEAEKSNQISYLKFDPLQISYSKGNIYGTQDDQLLEIKQNLGSPFSIIAERRLASQKLNYSLAARDLNEKMVIAEIKKAYFKCQFNMQISKLNKRIYNEYLKAYNLFLMEDTAGEKLLEKSMLETKLSEADMNNRTAYNQEIIAQNNLLQASFLDNETLPSDTSFEIYEIIASTDKNSRTPAHLFNNVNEQKLKLAENEIKVNKSQLYPSFFAGYSMNSIYGKSGFSYWTIGLSIPIFAFSELSNLKKSKAIYEMAKWEVYEKRSENDAITANILTDMNLYFERLNYYYDFALKQSDDLMQKADDMLDSGKFDILKYLWAVDKAFEMRKNHLENILNYNLKAAELEIYAY